MYQVLDYWATHPDATVQFQALGMVMYIYSEASYLSKPNALSSELRKGVTAINEIKN